VPFGHTVSGEEIVDAEGGAQAVPPENEIELGRGKPKPEV
jgi:hypothetical protein